MKKLGLILGAMVLGVVGCAASTSTATADDSPPPADISDLRSVPGGYSGGIAYCEHGNRVYVFQGVNTSPAATTIHDSACSQPTSSP